MRQIGCILFLSLIIITMSAQVPEVHSARKLIYAGYVSGNTVVWRRGLDQLRTHCAAHPEDDYAQYELALGEYGLIGSRLAEEESEILEEVKALQDRVGEMLKKRPEWSEALALMGGLYGMRVNLSPAATMLYGPKSVKYIDKAIETDDQCPTAWIEKGNAKYHAPFIFGGSVEKSIECYQKAIANFEARPTTLKNSWMYLFAIAWLGIAYDTNDQPEKARAAFQKALGIEPEFKWVRHELLPGLAKKD